MLSCPVIEGVAQCNLKLLNEIKSDLAWHETKQPTLHAELQKMDKSRLQSKIDRFSGQALSGEHCTIPKNVQPIKIPRKHCFAYYIK